MAQSLEEYVAQATQAYKPASDAIRTQLDSLSGKLKTTNDAINKNYAQQQATLNRNRNSAAETASMQAAGSGGSFGGAANIANRKYYEQSFVPAQTQLQTNQANELAQARQSNENERANLSSQLSNLEAQAKQQALQQYWAQVEAEKERENQRRLAAQQSAAQDSYYKYLMEAMKGGQQANKNADFATWVRNYSGLNNGTKNNVLKVYNYMGNLRPDKNSGDYMLKQMADKKLQKYYNQYQNWRNS